MAEDAADEALTDLGLALAYSPARVKLDVVFVHGLNGSRSGTWTNSNGELWPAWLGESVPGSRVWTYGYNSAVWSTPSEDAMELHTARLLKECANREVGKEMPELCLHAIVLAAYLPSPLLSETEESSWSYLRSRLASVVFLGTPHRGSEWANRLYILQLGTRVFWQSSQFVQLLRKGQSELLATIAERFNSLWGTRPVLAFRESKGTAPIGLIVKPRDARTNCSGETCIDVSQNHRRLAKVKSRDEVVYQSIVRHLAALEGMVQQSGAPLLGVQIDPMARPGGLGANRNSADASDSRSQSLSSATASSDTDQYLYWPGVKSRAFYRSFEENIKSGKEWEVLDEVFSPEDPPDDKRKIAFLGGTYCFSYPNHESTTIILTVPSKRNHLQADWTILSPNSQWHPGRHDGHFTIPNDFPFKPPRSIWDSPIVSPYVNDYGRTCIDYEYDNWSPLHASFYPILFELATIVIFGPRLKTEFEATATDLAARSHYLGSATGLVSQDAEQVRRVTNLFARAYNRAEADSELDLFDGGQDDSPLSERITEHHRQSAIQAVRDAETVLTQINYKAPDETARLYRSACDARGLTTPEEDFRSVETLRQYLRTERQWADALNEGFGNIAAKGWKKAVSYSELQG